MSTETFGQGLKRLGSDIADDVRQAANNVWGGWLEAMTAGGLAAWSVFAAVFIITWLALDAVFS